MKIRDLFVFAGQSNMMGAAVLPATLPITATDSYEYKHKPVRFGAKKGEFVKPDYPCGEFSYTDEAFETAYSQENVTKDGLSRLDGYTKNTYFVPSLCNLKDKEALTTYPFDYFSEASASKGPSIPPLFANEWEKRGQRSAFAHIAKGSISANYYFNAEMTEEYNRLIDEYNATSDRKFKRYNPGPIQLGASAYFDKKVKDFFRDAEERFPCEDTSKRVLVWCQGEGDMSFPRQIYKIKLELLWKHFKELGFTHFFCVRVGLWHSPNAENNCPHEIMAAQEEFCRENENCHIITRAMSFIPHNDFITDEWFVREPDEKYRDCRDTAYGFGNPHVNEKGFAVIAEAMADNALRVLRDKKEPILEDELIRKLAKETI